MVQTKHFLVVMLVCIALFLGVGVWTTITLNTKHIDSEKDDVYFSTLENVYYVRPAEHEDISTIRESFISKVRASLADEAWATPAVTQEKPASTIAVMDEPTTTPRVQFGDGVRLDAPQ